MKNIINRSECPVCSGKNFEKLTTIKYSDENIASFLDSRHKGKIEVEEFEDSYFCVVMCKNCSFIFQISVPADMFAKKLYSVGGTNKALDSTQKATLDYFIRNSLLAKKAGLILGKLPHEIRVLDLGSGLGSFLSMAKSFGFQTTGVEISEERLNYLRSNGLRCVSTVQELTDEKFDYIHVDQTLEHVNNPFDYLQKLTSLLSENGLMYLAVPNGKNVKKQLKKYGVESFKEVRAVFPLEHVNCFTNKTLITISYRSGLKLLSPVHIAQKLLSSVTLRHNFDLLQEGLKSFFTQYQSTSLYLTKK